VVNAAESLSGGAKSCIQSGLSFQDLECFVPMRVPEMNKNIANGVMCFDLCRKVRVHKK
jgi:hypothetical protein